MGEALDKVRHQLNLSNEENKQGKPPEDPMGDLESAIDKVDSTEARELLRARARKLRSQLELEASDNERRARELKDSGNGGRPANRQDREIERNELITNALVLLEKGMPANIVGQYLMGTTTGAIPLNIGGGGNGQGLTIADVKTIIDLIKPDKVGASDPELKAAVLKLTEEVSKLKEINRAPQVKRSYVVVKADGTIQTVAEDEPIIVQPPATGQDIEMIKEQNRHSEELEKLKVDKEYKGNLTAVLSEIPERIGKGLASNIIETDQANSPAKSVARKMEYFRCTTDDCGFNIPVPRPDAKKITCPKCHMVYEREEKSNETGTNQ
jgi:hypothetical protein